MRYSEQLNLIERFKDRSPVDVDTLALALGVPVHYAYLNDNISGMIEKTGPDKFRIVVNAMHPTTRQRFTVAHELGHFMMHRHLINEGITDNRAYRSDDRGKYQNTNIGPAQETQANKFAVGLLMPDHLIKRAREEGANSPAAIAKALGVSEQAYCIRAGEPYNPGFSF